ncbi:stage 0 sporulation family protein [uncultured Ruminococcus sp.]|uniref:PSP1 domain-containing protein n=1 Tax=uncultured Ruminococcus sp. TaxID=165186 RepID=UPI0026205DE6|nr:stage 0 sporulation family protein [uncultured Ruminococcus sp.]
MKEIVGVRFKSVGKIYYFSPGDIKANVGDHAIVETVRGVECGEIVIANRQIEDNQIASPLKPIIRLATPVDMKVVEKNKLREKDAFRICEEKIAARGLKMNLVEVECTFDNNKLLFYFTAENRVDFRELVKDLAAVFRTRIELRQIGVRDEAKILGGLGICGREFCCKGYMGDFQPVSIKMAKEQGLSLNPTKISGTCGRLMCCLKNEQNAYEALLKITPKVGAIVVTPDGDRGRVEEVNLITGKLRVKTDKSEVPATLDRSEVKLLKDVEIKVNREELKALKNLEDK